MINQRDYLRNVLASYDMLECKPARLPVDKNFTFSLLLRDKSENQEIESDCRKLIGSLLYAVVGSRPDLFVSVSMLSRFQNCASKLLFETLKNILNYVKGTLDLSLVYRRDGDEQVIGSVDSDIGGDPSDGKSTTGFVFKVFDSAVMWGSRKQPTVSKSSAEAGYIALCIATSEARWLRNILTNLDLLLGPVQMFEDNQSAIKIAKNPEVRKIKHLDLTKFFIKDVIDQRLIEVVYVPTNDQVADMFTKCLGNNLFAKFRDIVFNK